MLTTDQTEIVLLSTEAQATGHERLLLAFRNGDDLFVPIDEDRPANRGLLDADYLYVRRSDTPDQAYIYAVEDHRPISADVRAGLETLVDHPISDDTEVVHISGAHVAESQSHDAPGGFVAVVDGSDRSAAALGPAVALAEWYGRPLTVCAVVAGDDDRDGRIGITLQLEAVGASGDVLHVERRELEAHLFDWMRRGHIVVASAFGVWAADGRLHGVLNQLVKHNAPALVGVGPNVPADWRPRADRPLVVFVDASDHASDIVDRLETLLFPPRGRLVVAHVTTENPPDLGVAAEVAAKINDRWGLPVESRTVAGRSAAEAIGTAASLFDANAVVLTSWHRPAPGKPSVSSTSLTAVAHAPCPVVILSAE